jgi:hypothetical protein
VYAFHGEHRPGLTATNYLAVVGPETIWPGTTGLNFRDVTDGTSSTILIVESTGGDMHWMEPRDLSFADMSFEVGHPAGVSSKYKEPAVVMADGAVRSLQADLPPQTLRAMLTANGGEAVRETGGQWKLIEDGRQREIK